MWCWVVSGGLWLGHSFGEGVPEPLPPIQPPRPSGLCQKNSKVALRLECGREWGRRARETDEERRKNHLGLLEVPGEMTADRIFAAACEGTLDPEQARRFIRRVAETTESFPPNSSFSRFAQTLALTVAAHLAGKLPEIWAPMDPSVSAGPSGAPEPAAALAGAAPGPAAALAGVPPPAEGFHDARSFPELDMQPVPASQDGRQSFRGQSPELIFYQAVCLHTFASHTVPNIIE